MPLCLSAGAAKQNIAPPVELFPLPQRELMYYDRSKENIYVRAVAFQVEKQLYLLLAFELFGMPFFKEFRQELALIYGIQEEHIVCCDTYNHCAPREDLHRYPTGHCGMDVQERTAIYFEYCTKKAKQAVTEAVSAIQPARISICSGISPICMNRDEKIGNGYIMGRNPSGPCNQTYTVIRLVNSRTERAVANLIHYSLYGNMCYLASTGGNHSLGINGDFPGSVCAAMERYYSAPSLWLCGAAGNQNPLFLSSYFDWSESNVNGKQIILSEKQSMDIREYQKQWFLGDILRPSQQKEFRDFTCFQCASETIDLPRVDVPNQLVTVTLTVARVGELWMAFVSGAPVCEFGEKLCSLFPNKNVLLVTHAGPFTGYLILGENSEKDTFAKLNMVIAPGLYEERVFPLLKKMIQKIESPSK